MSWTESDGVTPHLFAALSRKTKVSDSCPCFIPPTVVLDHGVAVAYYRSGRLTTAHTPPSSDDDLSPTRAGSGTPSPTRPHASLVPRSTQRRLTRPIPGPVTVAPKGGAKRATRRRAAAGTVEDGVRKNIGVKRVGGKQLSLRDLYEEWVPYTDDRSSAHHVVATFVEFPPAGSRADGATPPVIVRGLTIDTLHDLLFHTTLRPRGLLQKVDEPVGVYYATITATWSPLVTVCDATRCPFEVKDRLRTATERIMSAECAGGVPFGLSRNVTDATRRICGSVAAHLALTEAAKVQGMQLHFTVTKRGRIQLLYSTSLRMVPLRTSLYTANPINTTLVFRSHDDYVKEQELKAHKALFGGDHRQPTVAVEISSPSPRHGGAIMLEDGAVGSPVPLLRVGPSPRAAGSASPMPDPSMSPSHGRGSKVVGGGAGSPRARRRRTEQVPVSEWRDDQHQNYMREQARLTARHGHLFDRVPATGVDTDAPAVMNHLSPHLLARVMAGPIGQRLKSKPSPGPHLPALKDAPPSAHADPTPRLLAEHGVSKSLGFGRQTPDMLGRLGVSMLAESALPTRSHSVPPLPTRGTLPDGAPKHTPSVSVHDSTPPMSKAQSTVTLRTVAETHIGVDVTPPSLTPTNSVVASSRMGQNRRHPPRSVLVEPSAGTPSAVWVKAPNGRGRWMPRSVKRTAGVTTKVPLQHSDVSSSQPPPVVAQVDASAVATDPDSVPHGAEEQNDEKDSGRDQGSAVMAQMPSHGSIENDPQSDENGGAPPVFDTMAEQGTATLNPETSAVQREREAASNDLARAIADALVAPHNGSSSDNDNADAHTGDREGSSPGDASPRKSLDPANQEEATAAPSTDEPAAQHEHNKHSTGDNSALDVDPSTTTASKTQDEPPAAQEPSAVPVAAVAPVRYNGAAFNALFGGCRVRSTLLQGVVDPPPAHTTRPSPSKGVKGTKVKDISQEALSSPPKASHDAKAWGYGARGLDPSRKRFLSERIRRQAEREKSAAALAALARRDGDGSDSDTTPTPGDHQGGPARHTKGSSAMVQAVSPSQLLGLSTLSTHKPRPASTDSSASTTSLASTHRSLPMATAQPTAQQYLAGPLLPVPEVELVVEIPQPVMDAFADAAYTVEAQVMVLPSSAPFVYVLGLRGAAVDYAEALHGVLAAFHPEVISHDGIDASDFPGLNFDGCTESPPPTSAPPAHPHDAYDQELQDDLDVPHVLPDTHALLASVSQAEAEASVSDQGTHDPPHSPARGVDGQSEGRRGSDALSWTYTTPRSESTIGTASWKPSLGPASDPSTNGVTATVSETVEGGSPRVPRKASQSHSDVDGAARDRSARRSLVDFVSSSPTSPPQGSTTNDTAHGSVGTHVSIRLPHGSGHDLHDSLVKPRPLGVSGASAKKDLRRQSKEDATPRLAVPVGSFRGSARLHGHGQQEPKLNAQASFTSSVSAPSLSKTCGSAMSAFFFFERGAGGAFLSARAGQGKKRKSYKVPLPTEPSAWFEADAPETAAPPSPGGFDGLDALYTQEIEERSGCSVVLRLTATPLEVPGAVAQLHTKLHVLTTQQRRMRARGN